MTACLDSGNGEHIYNENVFLLIWSKLLYFLLWVLFVLSFNYFVFFMASNVFLIGRRSWLAKTMYITKVQLYSSFLTFAFFRYSFGSLYTVFFSCFSRNAPFWPSLNRKFDQFHPNHFHFSFSELFLIVARYTSVAIGMSSAWTPIIVCVSLLHETHSHMCFSPYLIPAF